MATTSTKSKQKRLFGRPERQVQNFAMVLPKSPPAMSKIKDGALDPVNMGDAWEKQAYEFNGTIPELGYVTNLKANTGAQCSLVPQEYKVAAGAKKGEWIETADERALRVHAAFIGPHGGIGELLRRGFLHLEVGGDTILLGSPADEVDLDYGLHWEFLSTQELQYQRGGHPTRRGDGMTPTTLGDNHYAARVYRSDPVFSGLSDSPVKRVLGVCAEIRNWDQALEAMGRSHLSADIFFVPDEMTFSTGLDPDGEPELQDGEDLLEGIDLFIKQLGDHLQAPILNRASLASLLPLIMRGPAEMKQYIGLIEVAKNLGEFPLKMRTEALTRLARGIDIDPAMIEGYGQMTHWNGNQVESSFVTKQTRPTGDLLARALTEVYFREMLVTFEGMAQADSRRFRWVFDPAAIMARPDEAESSRYLHAEYMLKDDSTLAANGFDTSDKPDDPEIQKRLALEMMRFHPTDMGPVVAKKLGVEDWDWDKLQAGAPSTGGMPGLPAPGAAPTGGPQAAVPASYPGFSTLVDRLASSADASIDSALDKAVGRFATPARRIEGLSTRIAEVRGPALLMAIGPTDLAAAGLTVEKLLAKAWDNFGINARRMIRNYLVRAGVDTMVADDKAALASSELCQALDRLVAKSFHEQIPMQPNDMRVGNHVVVEALRSAGIG